ncbi:MAG: cation:proton antiporter [Marinifilaceae bacterium]
MNHLPTLITDLALILGVAALVSIIFKLLKQPPVLGYIVAGIIAGPYTTFTPSVVDQANVQTWAEIGVIFLLFSLGLDFSFKKLIRTGATAMIGAMTIILGMTTLGFTVGKLMDWSTMNCLFLGGMICMSSTSIIYKALDDLGLRSKKFAPLVLGILVVEDIVAIIMMVLLSTIAIKTNFEGWEMVQSIAKLFFFLMLWFIVGIYLIPTIFRRTRKIMNNETLTILAVGLCLIMVVLASVSGFSAALGAFVMGSILAETIEAEKIETLTFPIRDMFGAIFFVSVGMMVDPHMIAEYWIPILVLTFTIVFGQTFLGTFGVLLSGQPMKTAFQCGFCLTQIGEFAFIIASLGISLKVTDSFLYPIVVSVSVITTFITPYMIRLSTPAYNFANKHLPRRWKNFLDRYSSGTTPINHTGRWKQLLFALLRIIIVYSVIIIAILIVSINLMVPFITEQYPGFVGKIISSAVIVIAISPFLRAIVAKKNHSEEFQSLWNDSRFNRGYLVSLIVFRFILATAFVTYVFASIFHSSVVYIFGIAGLVVAAIFYSRYLKRQSIVIERRFLKNFNVRRLASENQSNVPKFASHLLSRDIHIHTFIIPQDSLWVGKSLAALTIKNRFGVNVVTIERGDNIFNIPGGHARFFPLDRIQVIGTDEQLQFFEIALNSEIVTHPELISSDLVIELRQIVVDIHSPLLGKTVVTSGIRENYQCMVVGLERAGKSLMTDHEAIAFEEDDILWVVGNLDNLYKLASGE